MTQLHKDPGGPPYRIAYQITPAAAIAASRLLDRRARRLVRGGSLLVTAAGALLVGLGEVSPGLILVLFGIVPLLLTWSTMVERQVIRRRGRTVFGQPGELLVTGEGIEFRQPGATGRFAWSAVTGVRHNRRSVIFVRGQRFLAFAPADAFGSPERCAEVIAFAHERIAAAAGERTAG